MRTLAWAAAAVAMVVGCSSTSEPSAGTVDACRRFRELQADPPSDAETVEVLQGILDLDTSASVQSAAEDLANALEAGTSTEVQTAVQDLDAACQASDL